MSTAAGPGVNLPMLQFLEGSGIILTFTDTTLTIGTTGSGPGGGDMLKSEYATNGVAGVVDQAVVAQSVTGSVAHAASADSVPYGGIVGLPSAFPSSWSLLTGIPASFPPSAHGPQHLPGGNDPIGLADTDQAGLVTQLDGNPLSYISGANTVLALPLVTDVGDATAPNNPSAFDDEFTSASINPQWTVNSHLGGAVIAQLPTYLLMTISPGSTGNSSASASETIVTGPGFMFQFKVRLMLGIGNTAVNTAPNVSVTIGLTIGTRSFGLQISQEGFGGTSFDNAIPALALQAVNGNNFASNAGPIAFFQGMADWRIRLGLIGPNLIVQTSPDAINWLTFYAENFSGAGTSLNGNFPTSLSLIMNNSGGQQANDAALAAFDYVRKIS